jgi:hypothetical protein
MQAGSFVCFSFLCLVYVELIYTVKDENVVSMCGLYEILLWHSFQNSVENYAKISCAFSMLHLIVFAWIALFSLVAIFSLRIVCVGVLILGIAELVFNTIQAADIDMRTELYKHIVLSGGSTMYPGLPSRLEREIKQLYLERVLKNDIDKLSVQFRAVSALHRFLLILRCSCACAKYILKVFK